MVRLVQTRPPTDRRATFVSLATAVLLLGVADSMVGSYAVLFVSDEVGLTPLQVGVFVSAPAMGGIVVSWLLGRRFDQRPTRRYAAVVTALGALGLLLMTRTSSFAVLVLLALTLLGGLTAAFPQLFALARIVAGGGPAAERSAPLLRSAWSLAWAIGPLIGAVLLTRTSFAAILAAAAGALAMTSAVVLTVPPPGGTHAASTEAQHDPPPSSRSSRLRLALLTGSVALFFTAMFAGSVALPLFVTRSLHQPASAVGLLFSACAVVEVVVALGLAALPSQVSQRLLIVGGMATFVVYFVLTVLARGMALLLVGQVARGVAIAVVGAAGIRFFQDVLAPATGRATTLFSNATTAGSLVAGVLAGASVGLFGSTTTLFLCGVVAALAVVLFGAGSGGPSARAPTEGGLVRSRQITASASRER
jgi:SET family sugar efflux transporter-like MFS transporter